RVLSTLNDAETEQVGYIFSGDEDRLTMRRRALDELDRRPGRLDRLTAGNPAQQKRGVELRRAGAQRGEAGEEALQRPRQGGSRAGVSTARPGLGQVSTRIRALIGAMHAEEDDLLGRRWEAARQAIRWTIATYAVSTGLALALLVVVYRLVRRALAEREQAAA